MAALRKIAFLLDEFAAASPAQQLLDRFLIGYARDGLFRKPDGIGISAHLAISTESNFGERPKEFDLRVASTAEEAVDGADAIVVVSRRPGALANEGFLAVALEQAPEGAACFVHGVLANRLETARQLAARAASRRIALLSGTPLCVTWRLPAVELPLGTPLVEALIVVQVNSSAGQVSPPVPPATLGGAELNALDGLLPVIERRRGGESGFRRVCFLEGTDVWRAGDAGRWSWPLLAAALSRSHTPQGDALLDGRTQDLVGLKLLPRLARHPRGWLLEHRDGLRTAILVLDGVVADVNFAVRGREGDTVSAQLFRAPPPGEQHYNRLAAVLEDFFRTRRAPWPLERNLLVAGLLERFAKPASLSGRKVETPELEFGYQV